MADHQHGDYESHSSEDSSSYDGGAGGQLPPQPSNNTVQQYSLWDPKPYLMNDPAIPGVQNTTIKIVMLGDGGTGKTSLLFTLHCNISPLEYIPTVCDNWSVDRKYGSVVYSLSFWDTGGGEEYWRLRPLAYPLTDLFVICFSVVDRNSFDNISSCWLPELQQHGYDQVPRLIVGTKIDLREDPDTLQRLGDKGWKVVTTEEGEKLAAKLGSAYTETTVIGLDEPTEALTKTFLKPVLRVIGKGAFPKNKKGQCCVM